MPQSDHFKFHKYYCALCPLDPRAAQYNNAWHVKTHIDAAHDVKPAEEGVHFYQGWQAEKKRNARVVVADTVADRFTGGFSDPLYSVMDFLADCGPEGPDEPPVPPAKEKA